MKCKECGNDILSGFECKDCNLTAIMNAEQSEAFYSDWRKAEMELDEIEAIKDNIKAFIDDCKATKPDSKSWAGDG